MDARRHPGSGGGGRYIANVRREAACGSTLGRSGWEEKQEARRESGLTDWVVRMPWGPWRGPQGVAEVGARWGRFLASGSAHSSYTKHTDPNSGHFQAFQERSQGSPPRKVGTMIALSFFVTTSN